MHTANANCEAAASGLGIGSSSMSYIVKVMEREAAFMPYFSVLRSGKNAFTPNLIVSLLALLMSCGHNVHAPCPHGASSRCG